MTVQKPDAPIQTTAPAVEQYDEIRARMKELSEAPKALSKDPNATRGFETWVRETSNGNIELTIARLKSAGII